MYRQAYLIIAHRYDETFKTLLRMLDSDENDIYVHMDLKNKQFDEDDCRKLIKRSDIYFTKRTSVTWGGDIVKSIRNWFFYKRQQHIESTIITIYFQDKTSRLKQTMK